MEDCAWDSMERNRVFTLVSIDLRDRQTGLDRYGQTYKVYSIHNKETYKDQDPTIDLVLKIYKGSGNKHFHIMYNPCIIQMVNALHFITIASSLHFYIIFYIKFWNILWPSSKTFICLCSPSFMFSTFHSDWMIFFPLHVCSVYNLNKLN